MSELIADILDDAADLLEKKGWTTGNFTVFGRHCAVGAISGVTSNDLLRAGACMQLAETLHMEGLYPYSCMNKEAARGAIIRWNDGTKHSAQEVIDTFRKAAKEARDV